MSEESIHCPSCGAPLDPKEGAKRMKCEYCGNTVKIASASSPRVAKIAKQSRKSTRFSRDSNIEPEDQLGKRVLIGMAIFGIIFVMFILVRAAKPTSYQPTPTHYVYRSPVPTWTVQPPNFAKHVLTFGSAGIVPGKFMDATALALDSKGNILVSDWDSGRINIFDADGNVISTVSVGKDTPIMSVAVSSDGQLVLAHNFEIHFYDMEGKETGKMDNQYFEGVFTAPDGLLYTVSIDHTISRYDQSGEIDLQIQNAFENYAKSGEMTSHLVVDGLGNMYLLGEESGLVLKFSADGTFLDKFGGTAQTDIILPTKTGNSPFFGLAIVPTKRPGTFQWPTAIAVDDYGRIYVCDTDGISVFDDNNLYIGSFELTSGIGTEMAFDRENHLYVLTSENTVEKFEIPAYGN